MNRHDPIQRGSRGALGLPGRGAVGLSGRSDPQGGASGAPDGFDAFVRDQRKVLVGYLCRRIPEEDAKDVAQEALVRLMRYRGLPEDQLRRLMYRIAGNALLDRGRRMATSVDARAQVSLSEQHDWLPSGEPSHEQRVDTQQQLARMRDLILQLPDRCREVYLLNRMEGMSYTQIAERCGISVKAVEKHVSRALKGLREGMLPDESAVSRGGGR